MELKVVKANGGPMEIPGMEPKVVHQAKGPRGDLENWNMARFLWARYNVRQNSFFKLDHFAPWEAKYLESNPTFAKAQSEGNGQDGGFLAPEEWSRAFSDIIRDESALRSQTDIQYLVTNYRVRNIPLSTNEWTWTYEGENATGPAATTRKFASHTMTMRKAFAIQQFSYELFQDSSDIADAYLQRSAAEAVAFEQDSQTLIGSGLAGKPTGILNTTNVAVTHLNATPTITNMATGVFNAMNLNASANVPVGSTTNVRVVTAPRILVTLGAMTAAGSEPWMYGVGPNASLGFLGAKNWVLTNSVPINLGGGSNQSILFYGDWRHVRVIQRGDMSFDIGDLYSPNKRGIAGQTGVTASGQPDASSAMVDVKIVFRYDVAVLHPEAFFVHDQVNQ